LVQGQIKLELHSHPIKSDISDTIFIVSYHTIYRCSEL